MDETLSAQLLSPEAARAAQGRRTRLGAALQEAGLDGLLIGFDIDIRYLTGFVGEDTLLLVTPGGSWLVTDPRYDEYLEPWRGASDLEIVMGVRHRLAPSLAGPMAGLRRVGVQTEHCTVAVHATLADAYGADRLVDGRGLVDRLRRRKDALELAAIETAIGIQAAALEATFAEVEPGVTERGFAARLEFEMKTRGAVGASFSPIVATGANSSVIHHTTGPTPIGAGFLLVDWGATCGFHHSDLTRTFAIGSPSDRFRELYDIVLEAQLAAIDAAAPGRTCAEIDAVARGVIERAGYGPQFGHGLGHGLGLQVHEPPYFNDLETETLLEPGMVMTVEPGIYVPGTGGVRIEDDIVVTESGCRVLGAVPKGPDTVRRELGAAVRMG